jgi:hypothetical protein
MQAKSKDIDPGSAHAHDPQALLNLGPSCLNYLTLGIPPYKEVYVFSKSAIFKYCHNSASASEADSNSQSRSPSSQLDGLIKGLGIGFDVAEVQVQEKVF